MKYNLVIFDLDGTILSTLDDLADSINYALKANRLPARTINEVRCFVGNGMRKLIEKAVPDGSDAETVDQVQKEFTKHYKIHSADKTKPYDGILGMMENLKSNGIKLAVLSNKPDFAVQDLCEKYFSGLINIAAGETTEIPRKPAPDGVYAILEKIGVQNTKCVYVGDSEVDVETATNSGMDCISVDWGFRDRSILESAGAKVIVSTPDELFNAICK